MSHELHKTPETKVEQRDMQAIVAPHMQKQFATNQGVRFYVDRQMVSFETAMMEQVTNRFNDMEQSWTLLNEEMEYASAQLRDLQSRLLFLESRWYERIMRYLEWDILSIRIWLFEHGWTKTNPIPDEPAPPEPGPTLELEAKVNTLPVPDDLQGPPFGECGYCHQKKFLPEIQEFFPEKEGDPVTRKRVCSSCKERLQKVVDQINAGEKVTDPDFLEHTPPSVYVDDIDRALAEAELLGDDVDPSQRS